MKRAIQKKRMGQKSDDFYACFSFLYPLVDIFLKPQKRRLFNEINQLPPGKLLEIGVGNGHHLALYKNHQVVGIDTSETMLNIAAKQRSSNTELLQMNGESLLFKDCTFDYIVLSHVIAVVDRPDKVLSESHRVLKTNGKIFILNHFTPNNWLQYVDRSIQFISRALHFKSVFNTEALHGLKKFNLVEEIRFTPLSYFKLLIYRKV